MKITLFILLLQYLYAKLISIQIPIRQFQQNNWFYITKFGGHIGKTNFTVSVKILNGEEVTQTFSLQLLVFLDEKWENVLRSDQCQRRQLAQLKKQLEVSTSIFEMSSSVHQSIRQHIWFFAIDDCDKYIQSYFKGKLGNQKLQIDIHIINYNGSEFSSEETGIIYLVLILAIANTLIFIYNAKKLKLDFKKNEELDWPLTILIIAIGLEVFHNYLLLGHLSVYATNGQGIWIFKFLSEIFEVLSRFTLTLLLILMAWGWSIKFISIQQFDFLIPIAIIIGFIQILIMGLGKITDDDPEKYHAFDGWVGYVIFSIEFGLYAYFYYGIEKTKYSSPTKVQQFLFQFFLYCTFYFLSFPIMLTISKVVNLLNQFLFKILAPYLRFKFLVSGSSLVKLCATVLLGILFTSKKSGFQNISYKNVGILDRQNEE